MKILIYLSEFRRRLEWKFLKYLFLDPISKSRIHYIANIEKIGTEYGGWFIPANMLTNKSICYCVGAGEDISFDVGIVDKYYCNVWVFDPTPRAIAHFNTLNDKTVKGEKMPISNNSVQCYAIKSDILQKIVFLNLGLWDKKEVLKFYAPVKPQDVSHSILNLQKTNIFFEAEVDRLSNIMKRLGHAKLDLLKIDIEGAEYKVIDSIIQDGIYVNILCVEFDELNNKIDDKYLSRIKNSIDRLIDFGYIIIKINGSNYTFTKKRRNKC